MAAPVFADYIDWANGPLADVYPTNFTALPANRIETRDVSRGRQSELDVAQTGQGVLALMDDDRSFDPENPASTYAPNVLPMRHVHETATIGGTTYDVFDGWVDLEDGWGRDESQPGRASVNLPCNDGFALLQSMKLPVGWSRPQERSGVRIAAILTEVGFLPTQPSDIDTGQELVAALAPLTEATDALSLIRTAEATEPGLFFFDHRGYACFHDRIRWQSAPYTVSQATFCDKPNLSGGRIPYETLTTRQSRITNDVHVQWGSGADAVAQDATSIDDYGWQSEPSFSTAHIAPLFAQYAANWRLAQLKDSYTRYEEISLQPGTDTATWQAVLSLHVADRITVIRTPNGGGAAVTKDCRIQSVKLTHGPGNSATWTARLAPADVPVYPLILTGPFYCGTAANYNDGGTTAWSNPTNAQGAPDGSYATVTGLGTPHTTQRLRCSNFGFAVPGGATPVGIYVEIDRHGDGVNAVDNDLQLLYSTGVEVAGVKNAAEPWPASDDFDAYGDLNDLWGVGTGFWTPAVINDPDFGVSIKGGADPGTADFAVDAVRMTIAYSI